MNITLSADPELVRATRRYALGHGASLNKLLRDYMRSITGVNEYEAKASEFAALAWNKAGKSKPGYRFNREEIHSR